MSVIRDGTYSIDLPFGGGSITDLGEGRYLGVLPPGATGPTGHHIKTKSSYKSDQLVYTFQFVRSQKYIGYTDDDVHTNTKLLPVDKPVEFTISQVSDTEYNIALVRNPEFAVSLALERIFPPWVALLNFPDKQRWTLSKISTANL